MGRRIGPSGKNAYGSKPKSFEKKDKKQTPFHTDPKWFYISGSKKSLELEKFKDRIDGIPEQVSTKSLKEIGGIFNRYFPSSLSS